MSVNCANGLKKGWDAYLEIDVHRDRSRDSTPRLPRSRRDCHYRLFSYQNKTFDLLLWRENCYSVWLEFWSIKSTNVGKEMTKITIVCQKLWEWHVLKMVILFGTPSATSCFFGVLRICFCAFVYSAFIAEYSIECWVVRMIDRDEGQKNCNGSCTNSLTHLYARSNDA